jgi:hypothetical protein
MEMFDEITDVALFYFVGHGQRHGDELCLALRDSPKAGPRRMTIGLPFADVRTAMRECSAATKVVILDSCFSGQATQDGHSLTDGSVDLINLTLGTGAFTMAASSASGTAWFELGTDAAEPQTYFTQYFLDVVERGLAGHDKGLALGTLFTATAEALVRDGKPKPTRSIRGDADHFIMAHNAASPRKRGTFRRGAASGDDSPTFRIPVLEDLAAIHDIEVAMFGSDLAYPWFTLRQMFDLFNEYFVIAEVDGYIVGYALAGAKPAPADVADGARIAWLLAWRVHRASRCPDPRNKEVPRHLG